MILEAQLEQKLRQRLEDVLGDGVQVIGSRQVSNEGEAVTQDEKPHVLAIGTGFRSHDAFSLSPVTVGAVLQFVTRIETDPDGSKHEAMIEKVANLLSRWHKFQDEMEHDLTTDKFMAGELRIDGGTGRTLDKTNDAWVESISISFRGSERF